MSNAPWDSGGMNNNDGYEGSTNEGQPNAFYNQVDYCDMNSSHNSGWGQNNWNLHEHYLPESSQDRNVNHNDLSGAAHNQPPGGGCYAYGPDYLGNQYWTGQPEALGYPQHHLNNDVHHGPHDPAGQQAMGYDASNFYPSHLDLLNRSEEGNNECESVPSFDGVQQSNEVSRDDVQPFESNLHASDQQFFPQASDVRVDSFGADQFQQSAPGVQGPPPVGTMTGIPTRNQFRKGPSKKSPYFSGASESSSNYLGNPYSFPEQKLVSPGSGDHVDVVADPGPAVAAAAVEEDLHQRFADGEVALLSQNDPSLAADLDSPGHSALPPAKSSEEETAQNEKSFSGENESKGEKEELKSPVDSNQQPHSSDTFNAFQHFSRKKAHRDSTVSPALWENVDMSPFKLVPKLVPTQEVEVPPSASSADEGFKGTSPVQNTGTGPSYNSFLPDLNPVAVSTSEKQQPATPVAPASFPLDLSQVVPLSDASAFNQKSAFQPVNLRAEEVAATSTQNFTPNVDLKQGVDKFTPQQMQQLEQQMQHLSTTEPEGEPPKQSPQLQQAHSPRQSYIDPKAQREHQPLPPHHQQPPQGHQLPQQTQPAPPIASQISDPRLSAFSYVKPTSSGGSVVGVTKDSGNERPTQNSNLPDASRKVAYSALNPDPAPQPKPNQYNNSRQDVRSQEEGARQETVVGVQRDTRRPEREGWRSNEPNPAYAEETHRRSLSRHGSDAQYYDRDGAPRRDYQDDGDGYTQRRGRSDSRARSDYDPRYGGPPPDPRAHSRDGSVGREQYDDPYRNQRPDSRQYRDDTRRPYDGPTNDRPPSRHDNHPQGPPRQDPHRPPSQANDYPPDRRYNDPRDLDAYGRPSSRQSAYDEFERSDRYRYPQDRSTRDGDFYGYADRYQQYPDDKYRYPGDGYRSKYREERQRNPEERGPYPEGRPRPMNPDERQKQGAREGFRPLRYADERQRDDQYDRPRSRQGHPPEGYYRSRGDPMQEAYNRPRSRQDDPRQFYYENPASYEEQYKKYWKYYNACLENYYMMHPEQRQHQQLHQQQTMDPGYMSGYYGFVDPYNRGFYQEMASYGQPELNQSIPDTDPAGVPSRSSSRNFANFTLADQFARESQEGSRPTSQMSGFVVTSGYVEEKRRLTPLHFSRTHTRSSFSASGQIVQVMPNNPVEGQPAVVRILSLCDVESDEVKEMKRYPGPIVKGMHKKELQEFCRTMSIRSREEVGLVDGPSVQLVWDFLSLLVKQNGSITGTDISELLIQGGESHAVKEDDAEEDNNDIDDNNDLGSRTSFDRSMVSREHLNVSQTRVTNRFRDLLLYGRKKEALDWAAENHLWGHALYLASQMDAKTFASIKTKFTNVAMRDNDPLQTLYQLMSGRQPPSVSLIDDKWRDWKPHLSMIISNETSRPELDRRSVVTLGDTLASRGLLHASHFCYIVAQTIYEAKASNSKNSKLILIGSPQGLPLNKYANAAIWATEIYEYSLSLADKRLNSTSFVNYKFIYMIRLIDLGLFEEALKYAEVLAQSIIKDPAAYSPAVIKFVCYLSVSLKMWDPQRDLGYDGLDGLGVGAEMEPSWCLELGNISRMVEEGTICYREGTSSPRLTSTRTSSEVGEILTGERPPQSSADNQWTTGQSYQHNDQDQSLLNQSQHWSNPLQNFEATTTNTNPWYNQQQQQVEGSAIQIDQQQQQQQQQHSLPNQYLHLYNTPGLYASSSTTSHGTQQQQQQYQHQYPEFTIGTGEMQRIPEELSQELLSNQSHHHHHHHPHSKNTQDTRRVSRSRTTSSSSTASRRSSVGGRPPAAAPSNEYVFGTLPDVSDPSLKSGVNQPLGVNNSEENPKKKQPFPFYDDEDDDGAAAKKKKNKHDEKSESKGWFRGLFSKTQAPKDVHLPDDSNPKIRWDSTKKKWVNEDADGDEDNQELAPPPVFQIPGRADQAGANMFSRGAQARGARARYADPLAAGGGGGGTGPSSAVTSSLLSTLPKSASTPANIFNPATLLEVSHDVRNHQGAQQATPSEPQPDPQIQIRQEQVTNAPQFFDPSEVRSVPQSTNRQPHWMGQRGRNA